MWALAFTLITISIIVVFLGMQVPGDSRETLISIHELRIDNMGRETTLCIGTGCKLLINATLNRCDMYVDSYGRETRIANVSIKIYARIGDGFPWRLLIMPRIITETGLIIGSWWIFHRNGTFVNNYYIVEDNSTLVYSTRILDEVYVVKLRISCT